MRRSVLLTMAALGAVISLVGGTSLFAALTDTAQTGTNSAQSAAMAASADIQLATGSFNAGKIDCGTFSEDLTSGLITVSDVGPGYFGSFAYFCVKNVGSQDISLSALAAELTDRDTACTGDEVEYDATTCGGDAAGELSSVLKVNYSTVNCDTASGSGASPLLANNATTAHGLGTLAVNTTACFSTGLLYQSSTDTVAAQRAQSDTVTWRYKFSAAVPAPA